MRVTSSRGLSRRPFPLCPFCPPRVRPEDGRWGRVGALGGSDDGGFDELCEVLRCLSSSSATLCVSCWTVANSKTTNSCTTGGVATQSFVETPSGLGRSLMPPSIRHFWIAVNHPHVLLTAMNETLSERLRIPLSVAGLYCTSDVHPWCTTHVHPRCTSVVVKLLQIGYPSGRDPSGTGGNHAKQEKRHDGNSRTAAIYPSRSQ